jgi:heterotetrameric sarcosine oxidase delta subunit
MLIKCPFCGERPHAEFVYGGDAGVRRPAGPAAVSDEAWFDYVYIRNNPRGAHREFWHHALGCDQWIEVSRDTLTHAIAETTPARAERERG